MDSSGLENIWIESGFLGEGACEQVMKEKGWNCVIRIHKLRSVLWACFTSWAEKNDKVIREDLKVATGSVSDAFANKDDLEDFSSKTEEVQVLFNEFEVSCSENATFRYWRTFWGSNTLFVKETGNCSWNHWLKCCLGLELLIISIIHVGELSSSLICTCCPQLHQRYTEALSLKTCHKRNKTDVQRNTRWPGHWTCRQGRQSSWRACGNYKSRHSRNRWGLTFNERAQLTRDTKAMFNLTGSEEYDDEHECAHKDFGANTLSLEIPDCRLRLP